MSRSEDIPGGKIFLFIYLIIIFIFIMYFVIPTFVPIYDHKFISEPFDFGDYQYYFYGGLMLRNGNPHVFDKAEFADFFKPFPHIVRDHHMLNYPPLVYVMFSALTFRDMREINKLWYFMNYGFILFTFILLFFCIIDDKEFLTVKIGIFVLYLIFAILFSPTLSTMLQNQVNCLLMFLIAATLFFYLRNMDIPAGIFLGLAISLKLIPVILLFFFILRMKKKIIFASILTIILIHLFMIIVWGPALLMEYAQNVVFSYNKLAEVDDWRNQSMIAFLTRLFDKSSYTKPVIMAPFIIKPLRYVLSAVVVFILAFITIKTGKTKMKEYRKEYRLEKSDWPRESLIFCLYVSAIFVLNVLVWTHHSILWLLPLPFIMDDLIKRKIITRFHIILYFLIFTCYGLIGGFNAWEVFGTEAVRGHIRFKFMMSHWPSILILVFWLANALLLVPDTRLRMICRQGSGGVSEEN